MHVDAGGLFVMGDEANQCRVSVIHIKILFTSVCRRRRRLQLNMCIFVFSRELTLAGATGSNTGSSPNIASATYAMTVPYKFCL